MHHWQQCMRRSKQFDVYMRVVTGCGHPLHIQQHSAQTPILLDFVTSLVKIHYRTESRFKPIKQNSQPAPSLLLVSSFFLKEAILRADFFSPSVLQRSNFFYAFPPTPSLSHSLTLSVNFYWIHTVVYLIFVSRQLFFSSLPLALFSLHFLFHPVFSPCANSGQFLRGKRVSVLFSGDATSYIIKFRNVECFCSLRSLIFLHATFSSQCCFLFASTSHIFFFVSSVQFPRFSYQMDTTHPYSSGPISKLPQRKKTSRKEICESEGIFHHNLVLFHV